LSASAHPGLVDLVDGIAAVTDSDFSVRWVGGEQGPRCLHAGDDLRHSVHRDDVEQLIGAAQRAASTSTVQDCTIRFSIDGVWQLMSTRVAVVDGGHHIIATAAVDVLEIANRAIVGMAIVGIGGALLDADRATVRWSSGLFDEIMAEASESDLAEFWASVNAVEGQGTFVFEAGDRTALVGLTDRRDNPLLNGWGLQMRETTHERALVQESSRRWMNLAQTLDVAAMLVDSKGVILTANTAMASLVLAEANDMSGAHLDSVPGFGAGVSRAVTQAIGGQDTVNASSVCLGPDGHVAVSVSAFSRELPNGRAGVLVHITPGTNGAASTEALGLSQYEALFDHLANPAAIVSSDGTILMANRAAHAAFAVPADVELVGASVWAGAHRFVRREGEELPLVRALRGEKVSGDIVHVITAFGVHRYFVVSAGLCPLGDGRPAALIVLRELTEEMAAETERAQLNSRVRAMMDVLEQAVFVFRPVFGDGGDIDDVRLIYENSSAVQLHGESSVGRLASEFTGDFDAVMQLARSAWQGQVCHFVACDLGRPHGTFRADVIEITWMRAGDELISVCTDRTDERRAIQAVEQSQVLLQRTLDALADAVYVIDLSGMVVMANSVTVQQSGPQPGEFHRMQRVPVTAPDGSEFTAENGPIARALRGEDCTGVEMRTVVDGEDTWLSMTTRRAALPNGEPCVVVSVTDVSERVRYAQKITDANERLLELLTVISETEARERADVARDLHDGPVQALVTLRWELRQDGVDGDLLDQCELVIDQLRSMVLDMQPPTLIHSGLGAAIGELAGRLGEIPIHWQAHIDEGLLNDAVRDLGWRLVREAVRNTLRHADATSIDISARTRDGMLELTVTDDGVGLDQAKLDQARSTGHFGLYLINQGVQAAGGTITFGSGPDGGAVLHARIPVGGRDVLVVDAGPGRPG
jgi:PAS domain S-box-containing protein